MGFSRCCVAFAFLFVFADSGQADIFRWDTGELIPGTEGVTPGPGVALSSWNSDQNNLRYADFSAGLDLSRASFSAVWLDFADFRGANLSNALLYFSTLTNADLSGTNLSNAWMSGSTLTDAELNEATVARADFFDAKGFTKEQLYSTASYKSKNLQDIRMGNRLENIDFSGANFSGQNLNKAILYSLTLTNADLSGTNLNNANLFSSTLTNADLSGATVTGANFQNTKGFTKEQLYSTASYQAKNLQGIGLSMRLGTVDLSGWDFSRQNLSNATLRSSTLTNADLGGANLANAALFSSTLTHAILSGATVTRANFSSATGFTKEQLYSTASYQARNLQGIGLRLNDLSGWDFSGQNLTNAKLESSTLTNANLGGANLSSASLRWSTLTKADLRGTTVTGANFSSATGFTKEQLYSTASYQAKNLQGIGLDFNDLSGWDFSGQNLTNANLSGSILTNADFSGADARGTLELDLTRAISRNTIQYNGSITGLDST